MWGYFHILRTDSDLKSAWASTVFPVNVKSRIVKATLESAVVLDTWKQIALNDSEHSEQLEQLSLSLLREITHLWTSIHLPITGQ